MYYSVLCSRNISSLLDCYILIYVLLYYVLLFHYILIYYTTHSDKIYKITSLSCKHVFWKTIRDVIIIIIIIITIITIIILIIIFICCRPQRRWPGTAILFHFPRSFELGCCRVYSCCLQLSCLFKFRAESQIGGLGGLRGDGVEPFTNRRVALDSSAVILIFRQDRHDHPVCFRSAAGTRSKGFFHKLVLCESMQYYGSMVHLSHAGQEWAAHRDVHNK